MKLRIVKWFFAAALGAAGFAVVPAQAGDLGISIGIDGIVAPGVYGRVNITNQRYPELVYAQPLIIAQPVGYVQPLYLHVPPGHLKHWDKHCYRYGACGRPVYFVRSHDYDGWNNGYINNRWVYREPVRYERREAYRDGYRDGRRDDRRDDRWDGRHDWDDRRGGGWKEDKHEGRGHGRGHGRGGRDDD
ncbi:hypothetical protein NQT62_08415 [Limnobacter humi]|uniref:DUF3300 domain-containing protein n=1 Tax=Limnobacter humi TaxID=1778671 RepID=A0ABT1WHV8_9BURK|nr:hypothetical protein [Limnobacter humi]MCQ8896453.1 hypothetical protein [Limnobacter humi]